jgi:GrpB-like predicted nucleotidyltransferase (UPF0157 family)
MVIDIVVYDPAWPARFARESARLTGALGTTIARLEHVGSTSVPGLAAKDIVDILLLVDSFEPESRYHPQLEQLDYHYRPDDEPNHRFYYLQTTNGKRLVHLHVCLSGGAWERELVDFRDRLRADRRLAADYERLKRDLAPQFTDGNAYADAKGPFIRGVLTRL